MSCDTALMPQTQATVFIPSVSGSTSAPQPLPDGSKVNIAAVQDSGHPHHIFSLGQFIGLALLGLSAYNQQNKPGMGPSIFTDPAVLTPYLQGILSLFPNA